ncbi:MAG: type II toxin-antitoxin system HicA family toxin [Acidobacteriia bacterium]|nr:type II toxin-antitoxin system HicA family toxin [Terriglobia bacterium]
MKTVTGKEFCRILQSQGWQLRRTKGSHRIYTRAGSSARISVPVHGDGDLKRGLQRHLMKIAEIKESDL